MFDYNVKTLIKGILLTCIIHSKNCKDAHRQYLKPDTTIKKMFESRTKYIGCQRRICSQSDGQKVGRNEKTPTRDPYWFFKV